MKDFGDQMDKDIKVFDKISSSVRSIVDKLIYVVKTLLEDICAFNVEYK